MPTWLFVLGLTFSSIWLILSTVCGLYNNYGKEWYEPRRVNHEVTNVLGFLGTGVVLTQLIMWGAS